MELLGAFNGILAQHRVGDEQDFIRLDGVLDLAKLVHQRFVNVKPAGRVDDHNVVGNITGLA